MPRPPTPGLFDKLVDQSLESFIEGGYRRTGVADIAKAAGIAPGTVYLYAKGKEALFELALRRAFFIPDDPEAEAPYAPLGLGYLLTLVERLERPFKALHEAETAEEPDFGAEEFERVIRDTYGWVARHWRGIALIERCGRDWPTLYQLFESRFRTPAFGAVAAYLARRGDQGHFRKFADGDASTRLLIETIRFFAIHRNLLPHSGGITDSTAEDTVVEVLGQAFVPTWTSYRYSMDQGFSGSGNVW